MATVILSRHWKAKGVRLPKNVKIAKAKAAAKRVRVGKGKR